MTQYPHSGLFCRSQNRSHVHLGCTISLGWPTQPLNVTSLQKASPAALDSDRWSVVGAGPLPTMAGLSMTGCAALSVTSAGQLSKRSDEIPITHGGQTRRNQQRRSSRSMQVAAERGACRSN